MNWKESQYEIEQLSLLINSDDGWKTLVQKLFETSSLEVAFFCLSAITDFVNKRYSVFTPDDKTQLKQALFTYIYQQVAPCSQDNLKIKTAVAIISIFKQEFPSQWPAFFDDIATALLSTANGQIIQRETIGEIDPATLPSENFVMMYLHFLIVLDQEVVANDIIRSTEEFDRNTAIKDAMRDIAIEKLVNTWYALLITYHDISVNVTKTCLHVIKLYISWIDIRVVLNNLFLPVLEKLISKREYAAGVIECLYEILLKGMPEPRTKLSMIQSLQVPSILQGLSFDSDEVLQNSAARVVGVMGTELLQCINKLSSQIEQDMELQKSVHVLLNDSLQLLFSYFNSEYDETSQNLSQFTSTYLNYLRKLKESNQLNETHVKHLEILLHILLRKCKYPANYDFSNLDTNDDFHNFRKDMNRLFISIASLSPELTANFLGSLMNNISQIQNPMDIEVIAHFLYLMGEGMQDKISTNGAFFAEMIMAFATSQAVSPQQPFFVHTSFFEVANRYARQLVNHPGSLPILLQLWVGEAGILNPNRIASASHCYLFSRFIRSLKEPLQPFMSDIVNHLKGILTFTPESYQIMEKEQQLELLESLSLLIGTNKRDTACHRQYIEIMATPLLENVKDIMVKELYRSNEQSLIWIKDLISALATFAKGFPLSIQAGGVREIMSQDAASFYTNALNVVVNILSILYDNAAIKEAALLFFRKVIVCVPYESYAPYISVILEKLTEPLTVFNMINCVKLFMQILSISVLQIFECLDKEFMPLVSKIILLIQSNETKVTAKSEEERELLELKQLYYTFILTVVNSTHTNVLASPTNIQQLPDVLQTILQGCVLYSDLVIQKTSFIIFKQLVDQWGGGNQGEPLPGFKEFIYEQLVPKLFEVPLNDSFCLEDARMSEVLAEITNLEQAILQCRGKEFESFLKDIFFPQTLKLNSEQTNIYLNALILGDVKAFRKLKRASLKRVLNKAKIEE